MGVVSGLVDRSTDKVTDFHIGPVLPLGSSYSAFPAGAIPPPKKMADRHCSGTQAARYTGSLIILKSRC
jgi:hypothetical protein